MNISIETQKPIEVLEFEPVNPLISRCQIKVCYVGETPNRNGTVITKEVAKEMAKSLPGSPIVGYFNPQKGDFEGHNREVVVENEELIFKDTTRPYGFVDMDAKVWFQNFLDNGVEHEYLCTEGYIWTGQYPESSRILSRGNSQSMELDSNMSGSWSIDGNGCPEFFIINEAIISKLCILGEDVEPCFEGASIKATQFSVFDESFKTELFSLIEQMKNILSEGGTPVDEEKKLESVEKIDEVAPEAENEIEKENVENEEQVDEEKKDDEEETAKEVEAEVEKEDKPLSYNLEEIQEYMELKKEFEDLAVAYEAAKTQIEELSTFKNKVEKEEKEAMIEKFYMLSEEDKKDVVDHIDEYSLDEIESKLSVICVRNKVSFDLENDKKENQNITYNLDESSEETAVPAWVKAVQSVAKKRK